MDAVLGSRQSPHSSGREFNCWNPVSDSSEFNVVGSVPAVGYRAPETSLFRSKDPTAFRDPVDFDLVREVNYGKNSIWKAECPSGYTALGQWCQEGVQKPNRERTMKCVKLKCTKTCLFNPIFKWSAENLTVFRSSEPTVQGLAAGVGDINRYELEARVCLTDKVKVPPRTGWEERRPH